MKKLTLIIFLVSVITVFTQGQQKKYFDAPFGGGVGYVPAWYIPNIDPINKELMNLGMPELSTGGFYSSGVAGFFYLGFIKFLRVGGMGFGGSVSTSKVINGINNEVVYSLGGGGLTIEYTLPILKDIGLSVGAIIGAGSLKIELYSNEGNFSWQGTWDDFGSDNNDSFSRTLKNSYWMFTPTVNVDFPVNRFIVIRIGGGYQFAFIEDWTADNDQELRNVPSDLNANSFFVQSGIFIGFFSF
jgi:hypothetical protein